MTGMGSSGNQGMKKGMGIHVRRAIAYVVLVIISFFCLFWFYVLFVNATRSNGELQAGFTPLPSTHMAENWRNLLAGVLPVWSGLINSLIVSSCSAALCVYFSAMTAYAIHAYEFKLKKYIYPFILMIMMIPTQVTALGFVRLVSGMHLEDSFIPLVVPTIAVQAIFTFVSSWNNYFTPALILHDDKKKTLPILIAQVRAADWLKFDMGQVYVMIAFSIFPVIVIYLILSKHIVQGVALGSVKG